MGTVAEKTSKEMAFNQPLLSIFSFCFLLATYVLATKMALVWICNELTSTQFFTALSIVIIGLIVIIWKLGFPKKPLSAPVLCLIASCGLLSIFTFSILQQLSASFALLGLYGCFSSLASVSPTLWRKGLIMAGLSALALPFALVPGTGMGFYLRLLTADAAAQLLALIGHSSLEAHDVLIFDNGIAQVDLPCSGLKSLFTGTGFFFLASLIMRREANIKWIIGYSIFAILLVVANAFRVTILIWVSEIMQHRDIAETIHMPLGLMLFCAVCMSGVFILHKLKPMKLAKDEVIAVESRSIIPALTLSVLAGFMLLATSDMLPRNNLSGPSDITLPKVLDAQTVALTPTETRFFGARDQTSAKKWMFEYHGFSGSMLVVRSGAANGLHAPEVCMLGNGISVDQMETRIFNSGKYRHLTVDNGRRNAVYWMQSERTITDDFRKRLGDFILGGQDDWVMVTILFDERLNLAESPNNKTSLDTLMLALQSHYGAEIRRKQDNHAPS